MRKITDLKPAVVWRFFDEITKIPRPSKKEGKINAYLHKFAEDRGLSYKTDEVGNTVIYKAASEGMENKPVVILQSHVDMVTEKNGDVDFDFDNDPIRAYVDGEWVKAEGTTLGADCGIGMAVALAVLDSVDIQHPAIEALFTVDEETGMTGAKYIGTSLLTGKYFINLDSEDEGEVFIGCAGGIDTLAYYEVAEERPKHGLITFRAAVRGLQGGHSGDDIHKGYANANRLLARFVFEKWNEFWMELTGFDGGNLRNAIPREAECILRVPPDQAPAFRVAFEEYSAAVKKEYEDTEPDMELTLDSIEKVPLTVWSRDTSLNIISAIVKVPNGVVSMSPSIPDFVETSTNLASVKQTGSEVVITTSQRSSVEEDKMALAAEMEKIFDRYGAKVEHSDGYPGWTPNPDSELLEIFKESYRALFGRNIAVKAIHAGLECGLILEKYPKLDMVSVGPTIRRVHSPDEKIEIATVDMFWRLMLEVLKKI